MTDKISKDRNLHNSAILHSLMIIPQSASNHDICDHWKFKFPACSGREEEILKLQFVLDCSLEALKRMYPDSEERKNKISPGIVLSKNGFIHLVSPKDVSFSVPCDKNTEEYFNRDINIPLRRFLFLLLRCLFDAIESDE